MSTSSAISRFTSALLAGSQENTLALAALNFDFSLYKVEAPAEYQPLGACLSSERRDLAESGQQHVTARKLGALFRSELPPAPVLSSLIKAYGHRVSDIAKAPDDARSRQSQIFAEHSGFDGTSIWAAATSGREALCMQLLACMLARFWTAPEAVAIWAELIESRKKNLKSFDHQVDFPELAALQASLTREHLAEWDASARSWLRTADVAYSKRQTQLRLIVQNVQIDVSPKMDTYESVMDAWISAMTTADNLAQGVAQQVRSGAVLLGLSAWHLYPDMLVYDHHIQEVKQQDSLIADGGLLTVGLELKPGAESGVSWSLSLTKLRFYGEPVLVKKAMNPRDDHIRYDQFMLIVLGSLFNNWNVKRSDQQQICQLLILLCKSCLENISSSNFASALSVSWIGDLTDACDSFLESTGEKKASVNRLVAFGERRCGAFLAGAKFEYLIRGILRPSTFLSCLNNVELRIKHLRDIATDFTVTPPSSNNSEAGARQLEWIIHYEDKKHGSIYATAGPTQHCRWSRSARLFQLSEQDIMNSNGNKEHVHQLDLWSVDHNMERTATKSSGPGKTVLIMFSSQFKVKNEAYWSCPTPSEEELLIPDQSPHVFEDLLFKYLKPRSSHPSQIGIKFEFFYGDSSSAGLYKRKREVGVAEPKIVTPGVVNTQEVMVALRSGHIDPSPFLADGEHSPAAGCEYLQALSGIAVIYNSLANANISTKFTQKQITSGRWFRSAKSRKEKLWYQAPRMSRANAFACIGLCESGDTDLGPEELTNVMALSISDSLYLAAPLLRDPSESSSASAVWRVLGNIGKPGMSLLIPPNAPMVRPLKLDEWQLVNHEDFNGKAEDSFANTSLHLSLTDYRVPYTMVHEGARDIQTFFQEAVVSIHDGASWIGDIDILKSLEHGKGDVMRLIEECPHTTNVVPERWKTKDLPKDLTKRILSVADNWSEILDRPNNAMVVRAHGNWTARLALTALGAQLGNTTFVVPKNACQKCFGDPNIIKRWAWSEDYFLVY